MHKKGMPKILIAVIVVIVAVTSIGIYAYGNLNSDKITCRAIFPNDKSTINTLTPILDWNDANQAGYRWLVEQTDGNDVAGEKTLISAAEVPSGKLEFGKTYNWIVLSCTNSSLDECKTFSVCSFNTISK